MADFEVDLGEDSDPDPFRVEASTVDSPVQGEEDREAAISEAEPKAQEQEEEEQEIVPEQRSEVSSPVQTQTAVDVVTEDQLSGVVIPRMENNSNNEVVFDRSINIVDINNGNTFPAPQAYEEVDIEQDQELYGKSPWFYRDTAIQAKETIECYAKDGWLPGELHVNAVFTPNWLNQFTCLNRDLYVGRGHTIEGVRVNFARLAMGGFRGYSPIRH